MSDLPDDHTLSVAIGQELRRTRELLGWSRAQMVEQVPSGISDATLLCYERGTRHPTVIRLVQLGHVLGVDGGTLLSRALQRARIAVENMTLHVDLPELLLDKTPAFRPMAQWARNSLNAHPDGIAEVDPTAVRNLALFVGCTHRQLAEHLARFTPDEPTEGPATEGE